MSNNKFHFKFKKRTPKIQDFFPFTFKKEIIIIVYLQSLSFLFVIYIYIFNYNRCKLSIFAQKNRRVLYIREFSPLSIGLLCGSKIPSLMNDNFIQKQDHKCQTTNFILNSKRELLKFRIFFPSRSKKKLQLMLISKVYPFYLFEKKYIYIFF